MPLAPTNPPILPTLPQNFVSPKPADALGGSTITCNALDDLQAKLDSMGTLDTLVMEAGALWGTPASRADVPFDLPQIDHTGWVAIRSSAEASLPADGVRINPALHAAFMPRIMTRSQGSALVARDAGTFPCRGVRLVGLNILNDPTRSDSVVPQYNTLSLGSPGGVAPGVEKSERFIVERCWIHGSPEPTVVHQINGITMGVPDIRIADCWVEDYLGDGGLGDEKCIWSEVSPGPILIENNYVAGGGQCVYFGGTYPDYDGATWPEGNVVMPSDIIIRRNYMEKKLKWDRYNRPAEWQAFGAVSNWNIKPTLELKIGRRVLIEGNHCRYSFAWPAFTFDSVDPQDFQVTGQRRLTIEDVTVRYNRVSDCMAFIQFWPGANSIHRVHVHDNLALRVTADWTWGAGNTAAGDGVGTGCRFTGADHGGLTLSDILFEHNTFLTDRGSWIAENLWSGSVARFQSRRNIWGYGRNGHHLAQYQAPATDARMDNGQFVDWGFDSEVLINGRNIYVLGVTDAPQNTVTAPQNPPQTPVYGVTTTAWGPPASTAGSFILPGTPAVAGIGMGATAPEIADDTGILTGGSPLKFPANGASDSRDYGVDFTPLNALLAGVDDGTGETGGDVTAPTVPVLDDPATNILASSYTLTWSASTDAVGVTGYDVEVTDTVTSGVEVFTLGNVLTFNVTGRVAARQYSNKVRAHDAVPNQSAYSTALLVTTAADSAATPAPPDLMRGFGPTRGSAASDRIEIPLATAATQRTFAFWLRPGASPSGAAGRVIDKSSATVQVEAIVVSGSALWYARLTTGTVGVWTVPLPTLDTRACVIVKHDSGSLANDPVIKINDVVQNFTSVQRPTGTFLTTTASYVLGNSRNWGWTRGIDGDMARVAIYDFLTSDAEDVEFIEGVDPLTIGAGPVAYHALNGTTNEPDLVSPFTSSIIGGTTIQNYTVAPPTTVSLSVTSGDPGVVDDPYQVTAATTGTVDHVHFFVDGELTTCDTSLPYTLFTSPSRLTVGTHTVEARVFATGGGLACDTDQLVISTDVNRFAFGWDPFPNATAYVVYQNGVAVATISAPPPGTQPQYEAVFMGADREVTFGIAPIVDDVEDTAALFTKKVRFKQSRITGFQELSRSYEPEA